VKDEELIERTVKSPSGESRQMSKRGAQKRFSVTVRRLLGLLFPLSLTVPALAQGDLDSVKVDPVRHKVVFEAE
jgi:hypothetical protein